MQRLIEMNRLWLAWGLVGVALLLGGCIEEPAPASSVPIIPAVPGDAGAPFGVGSGHAGEGVPASAERARVLRVIDGDTIEVSLGAQAVRVRYILINTPERDEFYGPEATEKNRALVDGALVYLEKDVSETDRFGRLLRYVYLPDGRMVNEVLVREGFAGVSTFPPDVRHEALLRQAQAEARAAGQGLWAGDAGAAVTLEVLENSGRRERIGVRNSGASPVDVSGWRLDGSRGNESCTLPAGTVLAPGALFVVASGDSSPGGPGMVCTRGTLWSNSGETLFLRSGESLMASLEIGP